VVLLARTKLGGRAGLAPADGRLDETDHPRHWRHPV